MIGLKEYHFVYYFISKEEHNFQTGVAQTNYDQNDKASFPNSHLLDQNFVMNRLFRFYRRTHTIHMNCESHNTKLKMGRIFNWTDISYMTKAGNPDAGYGYAVHPNG